MRSAKSLATTEPDGPTRRASSKARSPVPVATSSARPPGASPARSAARRRHWWCRPAVITEFMRSYRPAMRSNIAGPAPPRGRRARDRHGRSAVIRLLSPGLLLVEQREELGEVLEFLGRLLGQ